MNRASRPSTGNRGRFMPRPALAACLALLSGCAVEDDLDSNGSKRYGAQTDFDKSGEHPPSSKTLRALSMVLASQGKEDESRFVLFRAIQENPRFMPAYAELAESQVFAGRMDDAKRTLEAGLQLSPREPVLLNNLGMCFFLERNYLKALENFTQASTLDRREQKYRANMAVASGLLGRYQEALGYYKEFLPAADAHFNLGVICDALKDSGRALEEYKVAATLKREDAQNAPLD